MNTLINKTLVFSLLLAFTAAACSNDDLDDIKNPGPPLVKDPAAVQAYLSNPDGSAKLTSIENMVIKGAAVNADAPTINVDQGSTFQTMDGFGYSLTGGSAILLNDMSASARANILKRTVHTKRQWYRYELFTRKHWCFRP